MKNTSCVLNKKKTEQKKKKSKTKTQTNINFLQQQLSYLSNHHRSLRAPIKANGAAPSSTF